jgi:hypothetical protein
VRGKLVATLCSVWHYCRLMPTSSLAMRLFPLTQSRGTKRGQHEKDAFLSVIQNQEPRVRSLQEDA